MDALKRLVPVVLILTIGCTDANLEKVAKTLLGTANTIKTIQSTVITANDQKLLNDDSTRIILNICNSANLAGKQGVAVTRSVNSLTPEARLQLKQIIQPVVTSIQSSLVTDIAQISDEGTRLKVQTVVTTLQSAFTTVLIILETK